MTRSLKPIRCGFCLFFALTLAPTVPAIAQGIIILAPDANKASLSRDAPAVRNAGIVIAAALARAGFFVFENPAGASSGTKIFYAVYADIRRGIYLTRASLRIEARIFAHPGGRHLGRIEKLSNTQIRIPESCVGSCVDTRLGSAALEIARRLAHALDTRLREFPPVARIAERASRDW